MRKAPDPSPAAAARREAVRRYNLRHPERVKAHRKKSRDAWKASDPESYRAYRKKTELARKGLTLEQYDTLLTMQEGLCAICRSDFGAHGPQIDHDHACCAGVKACGNCVRGLLCHHCNMGLGRFKDAPLLLTAAIRYLQRPR